MKINITSLDTVKLERTAHLFSHSSGPTILFLRNWIKANLFRTNLASDSDICPKPSAYFKILSVCHTNRN